MKIRYELYVGSTKNDLRNHQEVIIRCFQRYLTEGCKVTVTAQEIVIDGYPDPALPRTLVRNISEDLLTYEEIEQYAITRVQRRLLRKKK